VSSHRPSSAPLGSGFPDATGFHLDLRIQVMRPAALHALADRLAARGLNTLVMEWEASFPYSRHATITGGTAYAPHEVRAFLAHCRGLGITVIPLQQTLGHLEYVLRHPRYAHLREAEDNLCQVCPCKANKARALFRELFQDMREYHDGEYIHLGGDEAYLLGDCPRCAAVAREHGLSRLYADYMNVIIQEAKAAGWRPLLWADMLLKHRECVGLLPRDTILVDWNYGWARDRFGPPENLIAQGFTVWGAAALRSAPDNHSRTEWARHLGNFAEFIPRARREGYRGMILTSWSTSGLYGYNHDDGNKVLDLLPVRRVYPLNGHEILLEAFADGLREPEAADAEPWDADAFLRGYARERFGLGEDDAVVFVKALRRTDGARLATLRPTERTDEWRHLVLIEAFAELATETARAEAAYQAVDFGRSRREELRVRLEPLVGRLAALEKEYADLQADYLEDGEAAADSAYRGRALLGLYARVGGGKPATGNPVDTRSI
jgi:hypothetical protein